jgi:hypothetical protein
MLLNLFICFILVLLILIIIQWNSSSEKNLKYTRSIDNDISNLKSGDLVFVSYKNILGKANKLWSGSKWTHLGMIYKEPISEKLYVLEMAEYNDPNLEKGALKIPHDIWLELNKGNEIMYKQIPKVVDSRKVLSSFLKFKEKKLHRFGWNPSKYKHLLFPERELPEKITCVEFVVLLLQELDVLSKDKHPSFYSAWDVSRFFS